MHPVYSIIVPCYNEEAVLGETHRRLTQVLSGMGEPYEIVYVNDGSRDKTGDILRDIVAEDKNARAVEDEFMFGDGVLVAPVMELGLRSRPVYLPEGATWIDTHTGAEYAGGQTVEADAPLEVIPAFVKKGVLEAFRL